MVPYYAAKQLSLSGRGAHRARTISSVPLPMTLGKMPPVALMHPMMGYPALVRMRALPVTADPLVAPAGPIPITTQPDISGGGRRTVFLDARWRRSNGNHGAYVVRAT